MAENKQSFVLYADQYEMFKKLSNEMAGELIKHIFAYVNDENPVTDNLLIDIAFVPIKAQLKRDLKRWESKVEARSRAGKASAEAKKANKEQQTSTNSTYVDFVQQEPTKSTDNVNVNVNVNDNVNVNVSNNSLSTPTAPKQADDFRNFNPKNYEPQLVEKFERFNTWVDTELPQIRKVKEQLTIDQFKLLLENFTPATIKDKVEHFGNTEKYWKGKDRRVSVFKTIKSWLKNQ